MHIYCVSSWTMEKKPLSASGNGSCISDVSGSWMIIKVWQHTWPMGMTWCGYQARPWYWVNKEAMRKQTGNAPCHSPRKRPKLLCSEAMNKIHQDPTLWQLCCLNLKNLQVSLQVIARYDATWALLLHMNDSREQAYRNCPWSRVRSSPKHILVRLNADGLC